MENYLQQLNPIQQQAVEYCDGPQLIIAGAGSGKTRVLTYKIVHLIVNGYSPLNILALTFTNKAAREMKERMIKLLGNDGISGLWIGTFHSIFAKLLRFEGKYLGYNSNYTIYDTDDSKKLLKDIIEKNFKLDTKTYVPGEILSRISKAKNNLILPEKYEITPGFVEYDKSVKRPLTSEIYTEYQRRLKENNAMDFDDLLVNMNILFRDFPSILEKYQNLFQYILVDEYQDTNYAQYLIIKKLSRKHKQLCVVGDDSQSIYAFRGARIENILNFKNDFPDHKIFKLEQNYRSTKTIVEAANSLIEYNTERIPKKIFSVNEVGQKIQVYKLLNDKAEAELVAQKIIFLNRNHNVKFNEIAILYRTNSQSRNFEDTLRRYHIPYKIYGNISFYQRAEIKDILAYLRLIVNPNDNISLTRIINFPARGIGETTINKIEQIANNFKKSLWEIVHTISLYKETFSNITIQRIQSFELLINNLILKSKTLNLGEFANYLIEKTGIKNHYEQEKSNEAEEKLQNIQELVNAMADFEQNRQSQDQSTALEEFLQEVALMTDQDKNSKDAETVTLMTSHSSKGLEFEAVFITGLEQGIFPTVSSTLTNFDIEEERRLLYVSMTRAKRFLYITYCRERMIWGHTRFSYQSMFLKEINPIYIEDKSKDTKSFDDDDNNLQTKFSEPEFTYNKPRKLKKIEETPINHQQSAQLQYDSIIYQIGQKVIHNKFGKGEILSIEGKDQDAKIEVKFEKEGIKKLLIKFAKLQIIEN